MALGRNGAGTRPLAGARVRRSCAWPHRGLPAGGQEDDARNHHCGGGGPSRGDVALMGFQQQPTRWTSGVTHEVAPGVAAVARARLATARLEAIVDGAGVSAGGSSGRHASQQGARLNTYSSGRPCGLGGPGRANRLAGVTGSKWWQACCSSRC